MKSHRVRWLRRNYHFIGVAKKTLLAIVVFSFRSQNENPLTITQFCLIYLVLFGQLVLGITLKPFINKKLNYLRSLSDLLVIGIFVAIQLSDQFISNFNSLDLSSMSNLDQNELLRVANNQKMVGTLGISFQLSYCLVNVILFFTRVHRAYEQFRESRLTEI